MAGVPVWDGLDSLPSTFHFTSAFLTPGGGARREAARDEPRVCHTCPRKSDSIKSQLLISASGHDACIYSGNGHAVKVTPG